METALNVTDFILKTYLHRGFVGAACLSEFVGKYWYGFLVKPWMAGLGFDPNSDYQMNKFTASIDWDIATVFYIFSVFFF